MGKPLPPVDVSELQAIMKATGDYDVERAAARYLAKQEPVEKPRQPSGNSGELDGASEKEVVSEIVTALRLQGYCTPKEWKAERKGIYIRIGQRRSDKAGTDEGCPDMLVIDWRASIGGQYEWRTWLFEVKARTKAARESKEQTLLISLGIVHRVNSAAQVLAIIS